MSPQRVLVLASMLGLAACSPAAEPTLQAATVPNCASVSRFGNGKRCDTQADITACGAGAGVLCASDWLCFDSAAVAFCACDSDADCQGRASYINTARASSKIAPMAARCVGHRCEGAP